MRKKVRIKEVYESIIFRQTLARRNARGPQTQSFQKNPSEENKRRKPNEGRVQGGVQKVECKRHLQKGKCRQGTHYARKHARWPATTCGSLTRIPPGQGLGLLRSPTSTKTEQKWDPNRPQMGPIWPSGGGRGNRKSTKILKSIKNANVKNLNNKNHCF